MATKATERQRRYDIVHCTGFYLKLHNENDSDIIAKLSTMKSKQGYIKQLIREDIARTRSGSAHVPTARKKHMTTDELYSFLEQYAGDFDGMYPLLNALVGKLIGYTPEE